MSEIKRLIEPEKIAERVKELAEKIEQDYEGCPELTIVCTLTGGFIFTADLVRALRIPSVIKFVVAKSYSGTESGALTILAVDELYDYVCGHDVLVVEDIVDTGQTLSGILKYLKEFTPHTLRTVALVSKPSKREVLIEADYVGFFIGDVFIVGYGLDFDDRYRELPYLGILSVE
jgi:hypoxanthine phosphoribosyltransferase